MLSDICDAFASDVEALDVKSDDYGIELRPLVLKLVRDAAAQLESQLCGEIPALLQRCYELLVWLKEDPEDRARRYARQQVVLSLLVLCDGIVRFHGGRRKAADLARFRELIADALQGLVPAEGTE